LGQYGPVPDPAYNRLGRNDALHGAALLDVDTRFGAYAEARDSEFLTCVETWVPRLLGLVPFGVVLYASGRSVWNLPDIDDPGLIWGVKKTLYVFDILVLAVAVAFFVYMVKRRDLMDIGVVKRAEEGVSFVNRKLQWFGLGGDGQTSRRGGYDVQPGLGPLLLIIVFAISAIIIFVGADHAAVLLPRALILPIIFGGWLPLLTFLSGWGRQLKAPLIVAITLMIAILSAILGDNHSVRRIDANALLKRPVDTSTIQLNQALALWMKENNCAGKPRSCPRPMIIVGSGGASRAGFFTASVIGDLLDQASRHVVQQGETLDASKIRKRIFAMSAVSGSAPGVAMTVAAFARAGAETKQPCTNRKPDLWYGKAINNWRDCLEALMAGDFLTPTMIGLTFHDTIRFGWWRDRAALLERSWERRFANVIGIKRDDWKSGCPGDLRCPFMSLRPKDGLWLPLLLINGTSAATGQRLLTTALDPSYAIAPEHCPTKAAQNVVSELKAKSLTNQPYVTEDIGQCPIFMDTTRFHTLLTNDTDVDFWARIQRFFLWEYIREHFPFNRPKRNFDDIRLSTAAHNSARFPVISPPGAVRNVKHNVVDRIVDGGYIENYGALTAMELAIAMHAIQPELAPFVLVISNDPDENPDLNRIEVPDTVFLTDVSIPLQAIATARDGRGRLAVLQLNAALDTMTDPSCGADTAHVRVWPQYVQSASGGAKEKKSLPVSLSWWLSTPIQIHLHQQTEGVKNQNENGSEIEKTWRALEGTSGCMTSTR
jgi:hypothetical protein